MEIATLPEMTVTNFHPENGWLEDETSFFGMAYVQALCRYVSFRECSRIQVKGNIHFPNKNTALEFNSLLLYGVIFS